MQYWVIQPEADAEFASNLEDMLETYEPPYDAQHPVVCMDEQPVQLVKETRKPLTAAIEHSEGVDYEYERVGTAAMFLLYEPLYCLCEAQARERRTKADWALAMAGFQADRGATARHGGPVRSTSPACCFTGDARRWVDTIPVMGLQLRLSPSDP